MQAQGARLHVKRVSKHLLRCMQGLNPRPFKSPCSTRLGLILWPKSETTNKKQKKKYVQIELLLQESPEATAVLRQAARASDHRVLALPFRHGLTQARCQGPDRRQAGYHRELCIWGLLGMVQINMRGPQDSHSDSVPMPGWG